MKINRDLRLKIDKYFTLDELRIICFDLSIDFDHIPGLDKLSKIVGLIEYVNRKDRLDALLNVLQLERPNVNWPGFSKKNFEAEVGSGIESDDPVRSAVWNALHQSLWTKRTFLNSHKKQDPLIDKFSANLWADYFNKPIDARPKAPQLILEEIRNYFLRVATKIFTVT